MAQRALELQAADVAAVAKLAVGYFSGKVASAEVRPARERAKMSAREAVKLETGDRLSAARGLEQACDAAWRAVEEASRFEAVDERFLPMARELAEALETLKVAVNAEGEAAVAALVEVKRRALEIERMHREVRRSAQDDPRFVTGLKTGAVGLRLSDAAESVQAVCDALSERLGGNS